MTGWKPLTQAQAGIWYAQARAPADPSLVTGQALHIHGPLDHRALARAIATLGAEAEALTLVFRDTADGPQQRITGQDLALSVVDMAGASDAEIAHALAADARRAMDLEQGPVAEFALWCLSPAHHILVERVHHIAADGHAMAQLTQRIAALYNGATDQPLAPFERSLMDEARFVGSAGQARQADHWHARLRDLPQVEPMARSGAADGTGHWFHRAEATLPAQTAQELAALAQQTGTHWSDVLTALTGAYVGRHLPSVAMGEASDVVLGIPLQNRMGRVARVVSTQVNVLPLHLQIDEDRPLTDWLTQVGGQLAEMRGHARYRGEALARETGRIGAGRRLWGPLVNILPFDACPQINGCDTRLQILGAGSVEDVTFCYRGDPERGLLLQVDGNDALYTQAETDRHVARLREFLTRAVMSDRLAGVATLTAAEADRAQAGNPHPVSETTLAALIERQMQASPTAVALQFGDQTLSYAELDARSARLARGLVGRGISTGARVAVALPRSIDLLVALVGVLRAGAAYVPLDPDDGSDRRAAMLDRAAPALILAGAGFGPASVPVMQVADLDGEAPLPDITPDDAAYTLFTSGSTGQPKGVVIDHRAIVNRLLWMREAYGFGPQDRILQKTPATFDVSVWEFFLPLMSGARLVIAPPQAHRDPVWLARIVRETGITAMHFVPSMLELFLAAPDSDGLSIPRVFASGEALPQRLADLFYARIDGVLHNLYGPTEAAVDVTAWQAVAGAKGSSVPIGSPVWNTGCTVLDARGRLAPEDLPARLYLSGRQLARGYLGQPVLTAERFPVDPLGQAGRVYDTGDLVTRDACGVLRFVGRADGQVKIRGVRIELAEIEAACLADGLAQQAVVLMQKDATGAAQLVAYLVTDTPEHDIRAALAQRLPASMQPAHILRLDALPLTPSGKLDRKALPVPEQTAQTGQTPPEGATEQALAELYRAVLGLDAPMAETDFFLAGGDSLGAVRLGLAIERRFGRNPGIGAILQRPVLRDLARWLDQSGQAAPDLGLGPVLHLNRAEGVPLFVVHPAGGLGWCYRSLAQAMDRPVVALQSPLLDPQAAQPDSLSALARHYVDQIEALHPEGGFALLGWSLGGIIAHAMTAEAEHRGHHVTGLTLLDSYPSAVWRAEPEPDETAALTALLAIAGIDPLDHPQLTTRPAIMGFLAQQGHPLGLLPEAVQEGVVRSVQSTNALVRGHLERAITTSLVHVTALQDQIGSPRSAALWKPFTSAVHPITLDCRHHDLIQPDILRHYLPHIAGHSVQTA
ncbi:amino acid adenylation domain-containing protein [Sagittula sp. SSi028]|uniref:amino acid adenylation domain-containing protein n=1 Tax=Sagittula sp. SSi028 TaxID=3400636 RepID=UPI003AF54217